MRSYPSSPSRSKDKSKSTNNGLIDLFSDPRESVKNNLLMKNLSNTWGRYGTAAMRSFAKFNFNWTLISAYVILLAFASEVTACSNPTTSFPITETFNGSFDSWSQGTADDMDWLFDTDASPSAGTGPTAPFEGSHYIRIEGSGSSNFPGKNADLISPCFRALTYASTSIDFNYHMYGTGTGSLSLDVSEDNGVTWNSIWNRSGNQGNQWLSSSISLDAYKGQNIITRFRAQTGAGSDGWESDIALDDVTIVSSPDDFIDCNAGTDINLYYKGINDQNIPATLDILETDGLDSVKVEIVYKGGNPGATTTLTDANSNVYTADRVSVGALNAYVYLFTLPATSSVTYTNTSAQTSAQSITAYGFRSGQPGKQFTSQLTILGAYNSTEYLYFDLPPRTTTQDIKLRVPISEVTFDNRSLDFKLTAGAQSTSITKSWGSNGSGFPDQCCIDVVDIIVPNVPASVATAELEIISVAPGGQSYVIAGVMAVEIECYPAEICDDGIDNDNDGDIDCADLDCGVILNRQFDDGLTNWNLYQQTGSTATLLLDNTNKLSGANSAFIDINNASGTNWHLQLSQTGHAVENGQTYQVFFDARAVSNKVIATSVQKTTAPYTTYGYQNFNLTTSPQSFAMTFTASENITADISLIFNLATDNTDVWIDNVQLKEVCGVEICGDGIDNDGDGAIDILDDECSPDCDPGCAQPYRFDWFDGTNGNQWAITNGESSLTRVYPISGPLGTYNVSVTLDNPDGQNIDLSNCGTAGNHFYTATCNDPNAAFDCDGDPLTTDGQFNYDCEYLTFGITSNNSSESVSITYSFEYPSTLCDLRIGDIDFQGSGSGNPGSWQDEIDIVADSMGMPVAISAVVGTAVNVTNNNSANLNIVSDFDNTSGGNIDPNDVAGHASITTLGKVTSITFTYSNGPADDGESDDHAIRITGFDFCPEPKDPCDNFAASIDFNGTICLEDNSQLTAVPSGGSGPYIYNWTGPNSFTGSTTTVNITENGNYFLTITDGGGCIASTSGFVYQKYEPTIVTLQTEVCEGESVLLNVNSNDAVDYQWSSNAGNATTSSVTVTPSAPSSTYFVTVTNSLGCEAVADVVLQANPLPTVNAGIDQTVCDGEQVTLTATPTGQSPFNYSWSAAPGSTNSVVFVPAGSTTSNTINTYTVTVTDNNNCSATDQVNVLVKSNPQAALSHTDEFCDGDNGTITFTFDDHPNQTTVRLSINGGSTWQSVSDASSTFTFNSLSPGTYNTRISWGDGVCEIDLPNVTIDAEGNPIVDITGSDQICIGTTTQLSPSTGGTWSSSNPSIASVNNNGLVTGNQLGTANFTFTDGTTNCVSLPTADVSVDIFTTVTISGPGTLCEQSTATLTASESGGTWSSSDTQVATISTSGVVTAIAEGTVNFTYQTPFISCASNASHPMEILDKPTTSFTGSTDLCLGDNTNLLPNTGGTWTSSNPSVASINNNGIVTSNAVGTVTFTFTSQDGCASDASEVLTVTSQPSVQIDYNGSLCLNDDSQLSTIISGGTAPYSYQWTGPNAFSSSLETIDIVDNGNYYLLITDSKGCTANTSGFVYQRYDPFIVNLQTNVCEGDDLTLSVNASNTQGYQWGSNAGNATTASVTVYPSPPTTTYFVTVTSTLGCTSVAEAIIDVDPAPQISLTGSNDICVGQTTTLTSNMTGVWSTSNSAVATVNASGVVTGTGQGSANFTFTASGTNCTSLSPIQVTVSDNPIINLPSNSACIGDLIQLTPANSGIWTSSNTNVATVSNTGLVSTLAAGQVNFSYQATASSCLASTAQPLIVNGKPSVVVASNQELCVGETLTASPSNGGIWSSSDNTVATITNQGLITATGAGTATFIFTNNATGCSSDPSAPVDVLADIPTTLTGDGTLCVGETTTFLPNSGGIWESENTNVATITNSGVVTAVAPGTARFRFTSSTTGCQSAYTVPVAITADPFVTITGDVSICINEVTSLAPTSGGTWQSANTSIATVDSQGNVLGVSSGSVTFIFTSSTSGCSSTTSPITVYGNPATVLNGPDEVCIGGATALSPSSGGIWTTDNSSIASVSSNGVVTGISAGTAVFTYTETASGCQGTGTISIDVVPGATVSVSGPNEICAGETTNVLPNTGGYWISSNPSVASVSAAGLVTGLSQGVARFSFVGDGGCQSSQTSPVLVYGTPQVNADGPTSGCIGEQLYILPSTGGTWVSSNTAVATITDAGVITGISAGTARFTFTDASSTCSSEASELFTIIERPIVNIIGASTVCIGGTTNVAPTTGGTWVSSNPSVATVDNNGFVVAVGSGTTTFTYTSLNSNCESDATDPLIVAADPIINLTGGNNICIGETTSFSANGTGTWYSTNPLVASISSEGIVTGLQQGVARFYIVQDGTSCQSSNSSPITVNGPTSVGFVGSDDICIGGQAQLYPSTNGTWVSSDPAIATVTDAGVITGIAPGMASFTFTDANTGCSSDGALTGMVITPTEVNIVGSDEICIGGHTLLSPSTGGVWSSSNPAIAKVTNSGVVKGIAPGVVTFTFIDSDTGCEIGSTTEPVLVSSCFVHDFNTTTTEITINSSVATNDDMPTATQYTIGSVISKPSASSPSIVMDPAGNYTFSSLTPGKYIYNVNICIPPAVYGCTKSMLEITVTENIFAAENPVSNLDIAMTYTGANVSAPGTTVNILTTANDDCVIIRGCALDLSSVSLIDSGNGGTAGVLSDGSIDYTPNAGFVGLDTIIYEVCTGSTCSQSMQVITVADLSAANTVYAGDDFDWTTKEIAISGNIMTNDGDPEGDNIAVTPIGTSGSPVDVAGGSIFVDPAGNYTFTPAVGFTGYTEVIYQVCDDQTPAACRNASLHILVFDDLALRLKVYLEGALMNNNNAKGSSNRPLMRDDLRVSPYNGQSYIPTMDPYTFSDSPILDRTINFKHTGPGLLLENQVITDSVGVFSVSGQDAIVDWVFVQLRAKDDVLDTLASRSALVQRDGDVVDIDGVSPLRFKGVNADSFYVVVKHRNHLGLMSDLVPNGTLIDFTDLNTAIFDYEDSHPSGAALTGLNANESVKLGYRALWAGDFNSDGKIKFTNPDDDLNWLFFEILLHPDNGMSNINYDFAYGYYNGDYNMDARSKFTNPDDDTNFLFFQILLNPINTTYLINFDFFIEHVPR